MAETLFLRGVDPARALGSVDDLSLSWTSGTVCLTRIRSGWDT